MREFELWIDESGDFEQESQVSRSLNPSLVGGILMPAGALSDSELRQLADPNRTRGTMHAVEMDQSAAENVIVPALEGICDAGGVLVYFENRERIDFLNDRELYLRVLASGLAQLVQYLSAGGPFSLNIIIAVRLAGEERREITPDEYRQELKSFINHAFTVADFEMEQGCNIGLTILSARKETKLFFADYACNARLTYDSKKYRNMRARLDELFKSAFIVSVRAKSSESQIRSKLNSGDISGALMEYYTGRGEIERSKLMTEIMDKFSSLSYRLQRLQIRHFADAIRAYAGKETDFERSEAIIKTVIDEFFGQLKDRGFSVQTDESLFWLYLYLADMYLREGDVINAGPIMKELDRVIHSMNYRAENLAQLYFYRDKKALYEINCMEYSNAVETMSSTIKSIETAIDILSEDELIGSYFSGGGKFVSEHLGDAYCMKIYAELFMQHDHPDLYETSLRRDSDIALSQYEYPGELERIQQYRSRAEAQEGNCLDALKWLLKTQEIEIFDDDGNSIVDACIQYLRAAGNEDPLSRMYYLMYYVAVMWSAVKNRKKSLADLMNEALQKERTLLSGLLLEKKDERLINSDVVRNVTVFRDIFTDPDKTVRRYHPHEIVLWRYGTYIYHCGSVSAAERYWNAAIAVCDENPDYTVLKLVAIAILLERLSYSIADGDIKRVTELRRSIRSRCRIISDELPRVMAEYLTEVEKFASGDLRLNDSAKEAIRLSDQIAF